MKCNDAILLDCRANLTFNVKGEIRVEFSKSIFDVTLVKSRIVSSGVVECELDVINIFLFFNDADRNFGRFLDDFARVGPNYIRFGFGSHSAIHYHQFSTVLRLNVRLSHESWTLAFRLRLRLDIQIQICVALAKFVLHVTSVRSTIRSGWVLIDPAIFKSIWRLKYLKNPQKVDNFFSSTKFSPKSAEFRLVFTLENHASSPWSRESIRKRLPPRLWSWSKFSMFLWRSLYRGTRWLPVSVWRDICTSS